MYQNGLPFDDVAGNGSIADQPGNIVVYKMQDHRNPDVIGFHVGEGQKDTDCNTSDKLSCETLESGVRCIIKQIQRQVPQSP